MRGAYASGSLPAALLRLLLNACDPSGEEVASEKYLMQLLALCMADSIDALTMATKGLLIGAVVFTSETVQVKAPW